MDRESLRPLVEAQLGESRLTVLSDETVNAELDAELEGITDDAQVDDAFCRRIASRLLRMNGNIAKEAGNQINDWKKKHPQPTPPKTPKPDDDDDDDDPKLKALKGEVESLKQSLATKNKKEADDKVIADVRKKFNAMFKEGKISINEYFADQVFGKLTLPALAEGEQYNIEQLAKNAEDNYYSELKRAGFKFEKPRKPGEQKTGPDQSALDKREAYKKKLRERGKLPKNEKE